MARCVRWVLDRIFAVEISIGQVIGGVGRCVRRAWLRGTDAYSGTDYSHATVVLERLVQLCCILAMEGLRLFSDA